MHSLTPDGLDAIEEGLDIINAILYHGTSPEAPISPEMWKLLPQMLHITVGNEDDIDGGFCFEYLTTVTTATQNYITKGQNTMMTTGPEQTESYFELICKFVQRILVINAQGVGKQDGLSAMRVLLSLLETFPGQMDFALGGVVGIMLAEI